MELARKGRVKLNNLRALVSEQFAQLRTMAMRFVFAITADREVRMVRQSGEEFDGVGVFWSRHFSAIFFDEFIPLGRTLSGQGELHGRMAGGEIRKPYVIPVL